MKQNRTAKSVPCRICGILHDIADIMKRYDVLLVRMTQMLMRTEQTLTWVLVEREHVEKAHKRNHS